MAASVQHHHTSIIITPIQVGERISHYWWHPTGKWYEGTVIAKSEKNTMITILYDDNTFETLDLTCETYQRISHPDDPNHIYLPFKESERVEILNRQTNLFVRAKLVGRRNGDEEVDQDLKYMVEEENDGSTRWVNFTTAETYRRISPQDPFRGKKPRDWTNRKRPASGGSSGGGGSSSSSSGGIPKKKRGGAVIRWTKPEGNLARSLKESGTDWESIASEINKQFGNGRTEAGVREFYRQQVIKGIFPRVNGRGAVAAAASPPIAGATGTLSPSLPRNGAAGTQASTEADSAGLSNNNNNNNNNAQIAAMRNWLKSMVLQNASISDLDEYAGRLVMVGYDNVKVLLNECDPNNFNETWMKEVHQRIFRREIQELQRIHRAKQL